MPNKYVFADEAGCFTFERKQNVSKYFILCTISMDECSVGNTMIELRRKLAWEKAPLGEFFHASEDKQVIRDAVYAAIQPHTFQIQATIMEKSKAIPRVRVSRPRFYQYGWLYHFRHGMTHVTQPTVETLVTAASIGNRKERLSFINAVEDVMQQTAQSKWQTDFLPAQTDPCLQVVDYCAWAIQRKWERGDTKSYDLIKDRVSYEYDLWKIGTKHHY